MKKTHPEAVKIDLDGEEYTMRIGPAAFRLAEMKQKVKFTQEQFSAPSLADLARFAYVGCLLDNPKLKEEDFLVGMAKSDEGKILAAVGESLRRMTDGLAAIGGDSEGNGEPGE